MKSIFLGLLVAAGFAVASAADASALAGEWKLHSNISGYENDFNCTFTQKGQDLTGTCKSGEKPLAITGKVGENKVTFQYKTDYQGDELTVVHAGTLESPTKIAGSVDVQPLAVVGDFTATKQK